MTTNDELPPLLPEQSLPENGNPSPVLVIFLMLPLLGILAALLMVATEMRNQRTTQDGFTQISDNPATLVNYAAPDFTLPTLDGRQVSLADYRGKTLFLNFWQTTCVPCITEMPEFLDFMADQNPDTVALLAINVAETPGLVREFFAANDIIGIPTALDSDSAVRNQYGVIGFPMTFIINAEGVVRFLNIGGMTYDDMEEFLYLAQTTDATSGD